MATSILITGSNRGIGKELLRKYLDLPNKIVISGVRDIQHETTNSIRALPVASGSRHIIVKIDSDSLTDAEAAAEELRSQYGVTKLDTIIANAGIGKFARIDQTPISAYVDQMKTNALGPVVLYLAMRSLLLESAKPRFVVISTVLGSIGLQAERPIPDAGYGMSKAAVNFFVSKLHHEESAVTAFPIHPGWVQTPLGNDIAKVIGMKEAAITEEQSAAGVFEQIEKSTREADSGKFIDLNGAPIPW
ncbi:Norsolorinic acid keto [Cyphellophora attinorum]|uniref:Norsolorinic acid keto n=1 Tax=Cyphellophora attinorum TaxID=1664694 RepID=A0A0N1HMW3_9EURO|nr:Norsolorinic acid keto [Phialophora attinorum]KPI36203.1 Norsolorinic acid keto [Phialophora attinorum]